MSLIRIFCPLGNPPQHCQWVLLNDRREPIFGEGPLANLPRRADRIQLVVPAAQVFITRARLPAAARRTSGSVLGYAIEERTLTEPDANQVTWLGSVADQDILAVVDRTGLQLWRDALEKVGIRSYEIHSEMLFLPWKIGEWSVAWNGREGFVRTGEFEAAGTDAGARDSPPLSLRLMTEEAATRDSRPASIVIYTTALDAAPVTEAWQDGLGVAVRLAGAWDWRTAPLGAGTSLSQARPRWRGLPGMAGRLRLAAWIAGIALAVHAVALVVDWTLLANEQRTLRRQMDLRFRAAFPDAVAVVDPLLQMRRKLSEARHAAGQPDVGDFLPMIEKVVSEMKDLPSGAVRIVSYEGGRMTLEVTSMDEPTVNRIVTRLRQAGLNADSSSSSAGAGRANAVITVRVS